MPQLDLLTISIQVSVMFFYSWGLFLLVLKLILPQYLTLNVFKEILWVHINVLAFKMKVSTVLLQALFLNTSTRSVNLSLSKIKSMKILVENFSDSFLNSLKPNFSLLINIFFYKQISLSNNDTIKFIKQTF